MRRILLALACVAPVAAAAQNFPDRPITIVLPYAPGSASDGDGHASATRPGMTSGPGAGAGAVLAC